MTEKVLQCPCCGHHAVAGQFAEIENSEVTPEQLERLEDAARKAGVREYPGGFYDEAGAAELMRMTNSGLRKQVREGRNKVGFVKSGNRRFYYAEQIAQFFY